MDIAFINFWFIHIASASFSKLAVLSSFFFSFFVSVLISYKGPRLAWKYVRNFKEKQLG